MGIWFKSDITIYDRDDFIEACSECKELPIVWEWLQRESIKQESCEVKVKNNLQKKAILKRLQISEIEFSQAIQLLGDLELIIFDDMKCFVLPDWENRQGSYQKEKEKNKARLANWREKKNKEAQKDVTVIQSLHNNYETSSEVLRNENVTVTQSLRNNYEQKCNILEERRGEEIREDKIREEERRIVNSTPCESQDIEESPPSPFMFFIEETSLWYKEKGIELQSLEKALSLGEHVLKKFTDHKKLKILLEQAVKKKPEKYLTPFGLINFFEWVISHEKELLQTETSSQTAVKQSVINKPLTKEERLKAIEAKNKLKEELAKIGKLKTDIKPDSKITAEEKERRIQEAKAIIAGKELVKK